MGATTLEKPRKGIVDKNITSNNYFYKKSVRVSPTRVSSFNIPKAILSLYSAVLCPEDKNPVQFAIDSVDKITDSMSFVSAKGISQVVCAELLKEIAYKNDLKKEYKKVLGAL